MVFKVIYRFILIGILLNFESCYFFQRPLDDTNVECSWFITNYLKMDVVFKIYTPFNLRVGNIKQDSMWIMQKQAISEEIKPFEYLNADIDSVVVYGNNGKMLKVWRKFEQIEDKRQFFDESFWKIDNENEVFCFYIIARY